MTMEKKIVYKFLSFTNKLQMLSVNCSSWMGDYSFLQGQETFPAFLNLSFPFNIVAEEGIFCPWSLHSLYEGISTEA